MADHAATEVKPSTKSSTTASSPGYLEAEESRLIWCSHIFNAILFCASLGAVCVSLWVWIELSTYESRDGIIALIGPLYYVANFTPLAEGAAVFFIIAVGAIGLCFKSRCTLVWYFGMLFLLCMLSVVIAIISFALYFELTDTLKTSMADKIESYYSTSGMDDITQYIDVIQKEFHCCGSTAYTDWNSSTWKQESPGWIPSTCCVRTNATSSSSSTSPSSRILNETACTNRSGEASIFPNMYMHSRGCHTLIKDPVETPILILGGISAALFLIQLISLIFLINLLRRMGPRSPAQMKFSDRDTARETLDKLDYWLDREAEEIKRQSAKRKKQEMKKSLKS
ncbi:CD151 antigen-like isoform X2 [Lytechinus variegatus]|uniref:CD151 antigen-like isoform X1 n=1 Tax=Lytechinus variegatus TaxID=7654 RepID=UPI001BB2CE0B|nr:CD151 antigen-like isoform X1 [Lytechinus variegatus]XP_041471722.1 CD151 antigen-like isoform X2 [Lytechinus variegatus]